MQIHITLHGILRDALPPEARGRTALTLPAGATVADALLALQLKNTTTAAINGQQVPLDYILHDGDHLHLFRPIGGGR